MSLLQKLREKQAANPPPAPETITTTGRPVVVEDFTGGYVRIFPKTFGSLAEVPEAWKAEFWKGPSPWCSVDGQPVHPLFGANLKALWE